FDSSAGLVAVFHALPRLLAPRHPPHALSSLTAWIPPSDSKEPSCGIACGPLPARLHSLPKEGRARVTIQCSLESVFESLARNRGDPCSRPKAELHKPPVHCEATLTATDLSKNATTCQAHDQ